MVLLDARGQPLKLAHKQATITEPKTKGGPFGQWAGRDDMFLTLPGGGVMQFDLSRLTLADYRSMRQHYQLGSSLNVLSFIMHQIDWEIKCENKEIKTFLEEQLHLHWTPLVRALSVAFWAGFTAIAVNYKNGEKYTEIDNFKDLVPEECRIEWAKVKGWAPPGKVQPTIHEYNGFNQNGFWIPPENTLWWPLLMEQGDHYGRKLLRAAFPAWFFSNLIHLFANRYFERFGEPLPVGRGRFSDDLDMGNGQIVNGKVAMETIVTNLRNRAVVVLPSDRDPVTKEYDYDLQYLECTDTETEILSSTGWKQYSDLNVGDSVLTLNHETGLSEWQPVQKVNVHQVTDKEMLRMEGSTHSSLTTLGHRWPVLRIHRPQKTAPGGLQVAYDSREWSTSDSIKQRDRIPLIADRIDHPTEAKYEDALIELVAWYWTEGYTFVTGNYVSIHQKRYPEKIRSALTRLFGPAVSGFATRVGSTTLSGTPQWRENGKSGDPENRQFFLNYEATQLLHSVCPTKIPTYEFILSMTKAQLDLYIQTAMFADGNQTDRQGFLMQKSRKMAEMFQFACIQAGHATSIYHQKPDARFPADTGMWVVSIRRQKVLHPRSAAYTQNKFTMARESYTGTVWCPTTANQTWLARRRGTVYFTGNSQMRGADFERYLSRLDEEMSLAVFTPVLLFRTADVGSYNLGQAHLLIFQQMLNAISGDIQFYLNNYLIDRLRVLNFGQTSVKATWVYRKQGNVEVEQYKSLLEMLIREKKMMPDLEELGRIVGLNLNEVKELVTPPPTPAPTVDPPTTPPKVKAGKTVLDEAVIRVSREIGSGKVPTVLGYRNRFISALLTDGFSMDQAVALTEKLYKRMNLLIENIAPVAESADDTKHALQKALDLEIVA